MSLVFIIVFQIVDVSPGPFIPGIHVAFVDAIDLAACRRSNVFMRKKNLSEAWVERESVDAMAGCIHHHRARAVNEVAGGDLVTAFLQAVFETAVRRVVRYSPVNRKYSSDAGIDVDVRRSVQRIKDQ